MKFLRGKVWQILLAVVALVAVLCVTASAEGDAMVTEFYLGNTTYQVTQGDTLYFTTNSSGTVTKSETAIDNWNIKIEFAKGDDAVPTMTLRDANINSRNSNYVSLESVSNDADKFLIIVERLETPTVKGATTGGVRYTYEDADSMFTHGIKWTVGELEIRGYTGDQVPSDPDALGRLTMHTPYNSISLTNSADLTFDHLHLVMNNIATDSTRTCISAPGMLTFNGGTARLTTIKGYAIQSAAEGILFTGNADVVLKSTENQTVTFTKPAQFVVDSGSVTVISENNICINSSSNSGSLIANGGTLILNGGSYLSEGTGAIVIDNYKNTENESNYYMSISPNYDATEVIEYRPGAVSWGSKKYFKLEPKYSTTVNNGTASAATAVVGAEVTLTAKTPAANQLFSHWEVTDGPDGFDKDDITVTGELTATFAMPAGNVTVEACYIPKAVMLLRGTAYEFSSVAPAYFTTDSEGVETRIPDADLPQDGSEPAYNIKLAFDGTTPVVYLKNAYLKATGTVHAIENSTGAENFVVVTEVTETKIDTTNDLDAKIYMGTNDGRDDRYVDSYIVHDDGSAVRLSLSGGVTFRGDGLLKTVDLTADGKSIDSTKTAKVTFDDANVAVFHASTAWGSNNFAMNGVGTVTVSGGKVSIYTKYIVYYSDYSHLVVEDGADLSFISSNIVSYEFGNLTVNGGRLYVKADGTGAEAFRGANSITVNGGEMEASCGNAVATVGISSLYNGSYAVAGASKATAEPYTAGNALSGKYFHIGKKITVTVTDGTAKAYNESAAQISVVSGDEVTFTANAATGGLSFHKWVDTASGNAIAGMTTATSTFKPTSDMSVTATFAKQAGIKLLGTEYKFLDCEPRYFTTTDGAITEYTGANPEENYNIKLAFDAKGVPTVYLNGATVISTAKIIENGTNASAFTIVTESDSLLDSYTNAIYLNRADLTLSGTGKLSLIGNNNPNATTAYGGAATICVYHYASGDAEQSKVVRTITLDENANVYIKSHTFGTSGTAGIWSEPNINANVIAKNGCALEVESDSNIFYAGINLTFQDYTTWAGVTGASKATATAYNGATNPNRSNKYFKIAPGYTVSVTDGSASGLTSNGGRFFAGQTVTLKATELTGRVFTGWSVGNGLDGFTVDSLADASASTTTFTMPAGNVSVTATSRKQQTVLLRGDTYNILETPAYYTTDANGDIIAATADTYTIKLGYNGETATVYLKGANLSWEDSVIESGSTTTEFAIETEAPSTILQTGYNVNTGNAQNEETRAAVKASGKITFRGDDLLTLKGYASGIFGVSSAEVLFENANVVINKLLGDGESNNGGWYEQAMFGSFKSITFNGGKATLSAPRILCSASVTITIDGGAHVNMTAPNMTLYGGPKFYVKDGYLYAKGSATSALFHQASGIEVSANGYLEAVNNGPILEKAPTLTGDYYAVMGASKETAEEYTAVEGVLPNITGKYFKVGPKATVTVTDGTAKAPYGVAAGTTIYAIVGDKITLNNADEYDPSNWLANWAFNEGSLTPAITNNTFTMPNGAVNLTATYEFYTTMKIMGTGYAITADDPVYFTTNGGVATRIDAPQDGTSYNIKLALVNDIPVVYLKGATLTSQSSDIIPVQNSTNTNAFVIHTESESVLNGNGCAIVMDKADLTFKGTGVLNVVGNNTAAHQHSGGAAIHARHDLDHTYKITVDENANVHIISNSASTAGIWGSNSSTEVVTDVTVKNGSSLEIESASNIVYPSINLVIEDYDDWASVLGDSKETATGYDGGASPTRTKKYFKIAPGYQVTVEGGTASGASSNGGRFLPGTTVTLTPGAAATGKAFWQWATEDDIAIASNKFTMIDSNVSVDAEWQNKASIYLKAGRLYNILEKTPTYMKIVPDAGATVSTEDDYDLKLAYTEDGKPAVYLKGAHMLSTTNEYCLTNGPDMDHLLVIVEEDSSMTSAGRGIYLNNADLTIRGPGKLTINSNTGGKTQYGSVAGILVAPGNGSTITFASDADVEIYTHSEVIKQNEDGEDVWAYVACIWIENGLQPVTIENGAKVQLSSPSRSAYGSCTLTIDAEYTDRVAIYGNDLATAPIFTGTSISDKHFFKIAPGYAVNVTNGTPSVTKALKGMNVTVTPNAGEENMGFAYWTSADVLGEGRYYESSYTFTMPVNEAISLTANYGEIAQVALRSKRYDTVKGGKAHYYIVTGNETITENGTVDNYNISFVWEEGDNTIPTLTLHNVSLDGTYEHGAVMNGPHMDDLIIRVSGVNNLTENQGGPGIRFSGNHLTIEGVYDAETQTYGTLNMSTNSQVLHLVAPNQYQPGYDAWDATEEHIVTINNVTMNMSGPGTAVFRIENKYDVYINNTVMNVTATGTNSAIYADGNSILQFNDSDVTISTPKNAVRLGNSDLTINGGTFRAGTAENPVEVGFDVKNLIIANATMEVFANKYVYGAQGSGTEHIPNLDGYTFEYSAVLADTYDEFLANPEGYDYIAGSDMTGLAYFSIQPKEVKVQIVWGAMSFTYDGAAWNTDTMTWEGTWTPVEGETETEAGNMKANQINVENVGTETVYVSFEFRQGNSFNHADVSGAFIDGNDAAIVGAYKLVRTAETDAFLNLNSAAVATDFGQNVELGVIVITIDALTPSQGSEA